MDSDSDVSTSRLTFSLTSCFPKLCGLSLIISCHIIFLLTIFTPLIYFLDFLFPPPPPQSPAIFCSSLFSRKLFSLSRLLYFGDVIFVLIVSGCHCLGLGVVFPSQPWVAKLELLPRIKTM